MRHNERSNRKGRQRALRSFVRGCCLLVPLGAILPALLPEGGCSAWPILNPSAAYAFQGMASGDEQHGGVVAAGSAMSPASAEPLVCDDGGCWHAHRSAPPKDGRRRVSSGMSLNRKQSGHANNWNWPRG